MNDQSLSCLAWSKFVAQVWSFWVSILFDWNGLIFLRQRQSRQFVREKKNLEIFEQVLLRLVLENWMLGTSLQMLVTLNA